jgi:oxalate decarboxylase/phosphoglucose isomerase-like protein (cupin superfamily)
VHRRPLEASSWAAQGGRTRWDSMAAQPGSAGVGCERELTSGAHVSARGEREDVEDGRHKSKKKTYFAEYAKGARGPSGPMKGMVAYGKGMPTW